MKTRMLGLACFALLFAACTGGGGATSSTEVITSDEGGTLEVGGATVVEIPAGAVTEDTEVTAELGALADYEPLEGAREGVVVFEPTMALEEPAQFLLEPGGAQPNPDQYALLYQFVDGTWVGVDSSTIITEDGLVESSIRRLAPTAVVIGEPE